MLRKELYEKTVSILVDAYMNDTLMHGDCAHCAVGNLLTPIAKKLGILPQRWANIFCTITDEDTGISRQVFAKRTECILSDFFGCIIVQKLSESYRNKNTALDGRRLIKASPYSLKELAKIECAFETAPRGDSEDEYMFNGLMRVIETLDFIHSNTDHTLTTQSKARFSKA